MGRRDDPTAPAGDRHPGQENDDAGDQPPGRTAAEWTTFAISLVVVVALVGAALAEHFVAQEPSGIRLTVTVDPARATRRDDRYYVPFTVANAGDQPAADVTLVFEVRRGETVLEESTADVPFLPVRGSQAGHLVTAFDPAGHEIAARVGTLQAP